MDKIPESRQESYSIKLKIFEGPLDLLLHLIRVNKIDIYDIPIVEITRQYNEYLDLIKEMNFEIAGDFLVMAATLLYIKSKMLLPHEEALKEDEEEDPRTELTKQLIDYQKLHMASENLIALEQFQSLIWCRPSITIDETDGEEFIEAGLFDLIRAFKNVLQRIDKEKVIEISREDFSIEEKIAYIKNRLEHHKSIDFFSLFSENSSRREKVIIFLALLELVRLGYAATAQKAIDDSIKIFRRAAARIIVQ